MALKLSRQKRSKFFYFSVLGCSAFRLITKNRSGIRERLNLLVRIVAEPFQYRARILADTPSRVLESLGIMPGTVRSPTFSSSISTSMSRALK